MEVTAAGLGAEGTEGDPFEVAAADEGGGEEGADGAGSGWRQKLKGVVAFASTRTLLGAGRDAEEAGALEGEGEGEEGSTWRAKLKGAVAVSSTMAQLGASRHDDAQPDDSSAGEPNAAAAAAESEASGAIPGAVTPEFEVVEAADRKDAA